MERFHDVTEQTAYFGICRYWDSFNSVWWIVADDGCESCPFSDRPSDADVEAFRVEMTA